MSILAFLGSALGVANSLGQAFGGPLSAIFSNSANRRNQNAQNAFNAQQAQLNRDFQSAEAEIARDWQEKFYTQYQSPEAMVRQYEAAGLNPAMMYGGSGPSSGSVPSTSTPSGSQATASQSYFMDSLQILDSVMRLDMLKAEIGKINSETKLNQSQAAGTDIENQFKPDLLRQDLEHGKVNIENLKAGIANLNAKTEVEKDQLLNNAVQRRLQTVSADKIIEDTNKVILEQATERLKALNIEQSTKNLAAECLKIEDERALIVAQKVCEETQEEILTEEVFAAKFNRRYREEFNANPTSSSVGSIAQIIFGGMHKIRGINLVESDDN